MRPIRVTGVVGTSPPVPLDVYTIGTANAMLETAAATTQQIQYTLDDVYNIAPGSLKWVNVGAAGGNLAVPIPSGARAIQCLNMLIADILVVSQQGIV